MKKTITAIALMASATSAHAIVGPGRDMTPRPQPKTYCLDLYEANDGSAMAGICDRSALNRQRRLILNENGCAEGQVALVSAEIVIKTCPTFVQL